eukprot:TRINITY_DN51936_c0_g1_i1.p1 TRINITY_DN51936_c0_g1~~TRINITY_DN51936_c0_g1_i1.p1  ORF type:complete len:301 (-),score=58.64 TRINITY_DN51936_c0_g1_i1:130-1032(-)
MPADARDAGSDYRLIEDVEHMEGVSDAVAGIYEYRSADKRSLMLMEFLPCGRWMHVARRKDTLQYFAFPQPIEQEPVQAYWFPWFLSCGSKEAPVSRSANCPVDMTVASWEMAKSSGTWQVLETTSVLSLSSSNKPPSSPKKAWSIASIDATDSETAASSTFEDDLKSATEEAEEVTEIALELSCDECFWSFGQSEPNVCVDRLYQATPEEREEAEQLVRAGKLQVVFSVLRYSTTGHRRLELRVRSTAESGNAGTNLVAASRTAVTESPTSINTWQTGTRVAERTLGLMRCYEEMVNED